MAKRRTYDRTYSALTASLIGLRGHEKPPEEVFHYTSAAGLLDIVESNELWATNLEFMNDFLEVKYAKDLFKEVVHREKRAARHEWVLGFLDDTANTLDPFTREFSCYAVSFCADGGDRLSQWRAYASEGTGYSIGFRTTELIEAIGRYRAATGNEQMELIEVVYGRNEQEVIVQNAVRKICHYIEEHLIASNARKPERALAALPKLLCVHLFPYVFSFKTGGFEEEREWRLVTWIPSAVESTRVHFRASANFTIPYLSLNLWNRSQEKGKLPISRIIQGPRVEAEVGMKSLELLLKKYGHSDTRVLLSRIPFRYVT